MIRRALLLGFYSIGAQVLLLRELVASLNGDELFISTALFGWLISVALGAYLGGRQRSGAHGLFMPAAILLPIMLLLARFSPSLTGHMVGQVVPFTVAALISIVVMLPVGMVSGWMFPAITRQHLKTETSIVRVYLFEGIGAFLGGLVIVYLVGPWLSALQMAFAISVIMLAAENISYARSSIQQIRRILITLIVLPASIFMSTYLESHLNDLQYRPFNVLDSFDTHYGRQTILGQPGEQILLSDNNIEAVSADFSTAENLLLPPLLYYPSAKRILYIGRPEYGLAELADSLPGVSLTGLDPRRGRLRIVADDALPVSRPPEMIHSDPVTYFSSAQRTAPSYDIVVLNTGNLGSYKSSRLITSDFLQKAKRMCPGVFLVMTRYDTDSHISAEEKIILSSIFNVLTGAFNYVNVWPGTATLFIASDLPATDRLPYDSIITRLDSLGYQPQFVSADYLPDRLGSFKKERLLSALANPAGGNSLSRPQLIHQHLLYQAHIDSLDKAFLSFIVYNSDYVAAAIAIIILAFLAFSLRGKRSRFGLFLFFVAGAVSLSLELIVFYTFQSLAGALYSQMAMLIGAFMLGLAVGTALASLMPNRLCGYVALVILIALTIAFRVNYQPMATGMEYADRLPILHLVFLFAAAAATGALFVAATRRFYADKPQGNRGAGYAFEIGGSSIAALFTMAVVLPAIGLDWLLIALAVLIGLSLVGLVVRR